MHKHTAILLRNIASHGIRELYRASASASMVKCYSMRV